MDKDDLYYAIGTLLGVVGLVVTLVGTDLEA